MVPAAIQRHVLSYSQCPPSLLAVYFQCPSSLTPIKCIRRGVEMQYKGANFARHAGGRTFESCTAHLCKCFIYKYLPFVTHLLNTPMKAENRLRRQSGVTLLRLTGVANKFLYHRRRFFLMLHIHLVVELQSRINLAVTQ
jgi:hypothetical protein